MKFGFCGLVCLILSSTTLAMGRGSGSKSSTVEKPKLQSFVSDGCTIPNYITNENYSECCLQHDFAYWRGGSFTDKKNADVALINCIRSKGAFVFTSGVWQTILQNFGATKFGGRWTPRRKNLPLNEEELEQVQKLTQNYFKSQIPLVNSYSSARACPGNVKDVVKVVTTLEDFNEITCYNLVPDKSNASSAMHIVFSNECKDGYFIYQPKESSKYETLGGYGMCHDKMSPVFKDTTPPRIDYKTAPAPGKR